MKTRAFIAISRSDHDGSAEPAQRLATSGICNNNNVRGERANFTGLLLGCIETSNQVRSVLFMKKKRNPGIRPILQPNIRWNSYVFRKGG